MSIRIATINLQGVSDVTSLQDSISVSLHSPILEVTDRYDGRPVSPEFANEVPDAPELFHAGLCVMLAVVWW